LTPKQEKEQFIVTHYRNKHLLFPQSLLAAKNKKSCIFIMY